jgi:hypothetical protein
MYAQERRTSRRIPLSSKGCVIINGVDVDIRTHDLSLGGALVEFDAAFPPVTEGMKLRVYLNAGFIGRAIVCRTIASKSCTLFGLKFDRFDFRTDQMLGAFIVGLENGLSEMVTIH